MDTTRWERLQALFHRAIELPEAERRSFVEAECGDDPGLGTDALALLAEDASGASLLDRGVSAVAQRMLEGAPASTLPLQSFGAYHVRGVLGEGGMGVVYLAERADLGSVAAIKVLRDAWLSPARRERFAAEQRTLAQLNHPSIARLYDANALPDGTPWFVMEYVDGVPITTYCDQHQSTIAERLTLFRSVCEAVRHAHAHLVVHRDLKPSNVLVAGDGAVKLLDFGIAKHLEPVSVPASHTRTALRLMTPAYAAPEQIRGERVGTHTDVYSLGVVLYELLAGQLPFDLSDRTPGEAETIIVTEEPERPSAVAKRATRATGAKERALTTARTSWSDLDVLCLTAMHKDPERRYRTVDALIRDVDHYLRGEPLEARPDGTRYRLGKFLRRHWRPVAAAALVLAAGLALATYYTVRLATARNAALAEAARTQRLQRFMLNLFEGGDEAAGPADTLRVVTLVRRGVLEARSLDAEPALQAELYETLGTMSQGLGELAMADTLLRAALDRRRSLHAGDHPDVAGSLTAIALLRNGQAEFAEAERLAREGVAMYRRTVPSGHPALARATSALGRVLEERGEYAEAVRVLEEAARLQSAPGAVASDLSITLTELANTHFYMGHYAASDSLNRRVLEMDRRTFGERHPHVADGLINLGAVQFEWGRYREAERLYRQALDIIRTWYGEDHAETASSLTMLGRALVADGRPEEATDILRRALAINERVYGPVHPRVASTLNELGKVAQSHGALDEAEADFRRMADIYRVVHGDRHYLTGIALSNLASVHMERGQHARAERLLRDVVRRFTESLAADHTNTGIARIKLGRALLRQRRYAEAERESRAGYAILAGQTSPPASWMQRAATDLADEYAALGQSDSAAKFRAEVARTAADGGAVPGSPR